MNTQPSIYTPAEQANIERVTGGHAGLLIRAEKVLDDFNGMYGSIAIEGALCQWCGARKYTPKAGIVHLSGCIILEMRRVIALPPEQTT